MIMKRIPLVALLVLFASAARAQMTPEQVTTLRTVTSVALSPDGRTVAYTIAQPRAPEEDTVAGLRSYSEVWLVPAAGGSPRALVQRPNSAGNISWSPDGSQIGFTYRGQVHAVPAAGGEMKQLTRSPNGVVAFQWAPDGRSIAYTARVAEPATVVDRRRRG